MRLHAATGEGPRSGPGLVSVSTSDTRGFSTEAFWNANVITLNPEEQRILRLRKSVGVGAKCMWHLRPGAQKRERLIMVTLTYAGDNRNWHPRHISAYIKRVREWMRRQGHTLRYLWVAELQERGVIHYHAVFWMPRGITMPRADKRGWWPHGMTRTEAVRNPVSYLMSYVSKVESKNVGSFPHGARISAVGGLCAAGRDIRRWVLWPGYLQANAAVGERWKPALGGGFINHEDGRFLGAEFAPTGGGFRSFVRVRTHERSIEAAGPFCWLQGAAP